MQSKTGYKMYMFMKKADRLSEKMSKDEGAEGEKETEK